MLFQMLKGGITRFFPSCERTAIAMGLAGGSKKQIWNEKSLYTTGFFTIGTLSVIVTSVNKGEARKGKKT